MWRGVYKNERFKHDVQGRNRVGGCGLGTTCREIGWSGEWRGWRRRRMEKEEEEGKRGGYREMVPMITRDHETKRPGAACACAPGGAVSILALSA